MSVLSTTKFRVPLAAIAWLAGIGFSMPLLAAGQVYKWTDGNGVVHYTNVKNDSSITGAAAINEAPAATAEASSGRGSRQFAIFKFRDAVGVLHYTDQRPRNRNYVVISLFCPACDPHSKINWNATRLNLTAYAEDIDKNAAEFGVDPTLVRALIHAESAFNADAESKKGAQGLMQLMPETAGQYGVSNAYDASQNIRAGVRHLAYLLKSFNGDERLAAAAYNAGEGAVRKYNGIPPYDETRVYVDRVGVLHQRYKSGG